MPFKLIQNLTKVTINLYSIIYIISWCQFWFFCTIIIVKMMAQKKQALKVLAFNFYVA